MTWSKPDFVEISLNMEVTGYVNTDDQQGTGNREQGTGNKGQGKGNSGQASKSDRDS